MPLWGSHSDQKEMTSNICVMLGGDKRTQGRRKRIREWRDEGCILFYFLLFRAARAAYGGSQARGPISYGCWPTPKPQQSGI